MIKNNIVSAITSVIISITTLIVYYKLVNNYLICMMLFILNMGILFFAGYALGGKLLTIYDDRLKNLLSICVITILCMILVLCIHFGYNGAVVSDLDKYDPMEGHLINVWIFLHGTMVPVIALVQPILGFDGWGFFMYMFFTLLPLMLVWGGLELKAVRLRKLNEARAQVQENTPEMLHGSSYEGEHTINL